MAPRVQHLWLIRHGATSATEARAFGADESLIPAAGAAAARLADVLPAGAAARCSPARRCRETAAAAGLEAFVDPRLDQVDIGGWRGRTWSEVHDADPTGMAAWLEDPAAAPHGGESLAALASRTAGWLDALAGRDRDGGDDRGEVSADADAETLVVVTHSEIVRTVALAALGAPLRAFWQLTVDPLSITELRLYEGVWSVQRLNAGGPA